MALPSPGSGLRSVRAIYVRPWRIDVSLRPGVRLPVPVMWLARTAAAALTAAGAPSPASLALIFSDDHELTDLNKRYMGKDGPTDVLSFPLLPPGAFPPHAGKGPDPAAGRPIEPAFQTPHGLRDHLGDILMSVERAEAQASESRGGQSSGIGWSAADEIRLLVVHGVLHVCGYDHAVPEENDAMRALEKKVMAQE